MQKWQRIQYQPVQPLGADGRLVTGSPAHIALDRKAAAAGAVLLKNTDHTLPLAHGTHLAVFGRAAIDYSKGGWGSGDVNAAFAQNVIDGLQEKAATGQVVLADDLISFYQQHNAKELANGVEAGHISEPAIPEDLLQTTAAFADTALIVIGRNSGEGWDRKAEAGDYYLSADETTLIAAVTAHFAKVIVILNISVASDTSWFAHNPDIQAALLAWQGGNASGGAIADLLVGDVNPSGKLVDTLADRFESYPSAEHFNDSDDYVDYTEDIYVGYRYFTTQNQQAHVNYAFGHGLSYTTFAIAYQQGQADSDNLTIDCTVTNTGSAAGQEVVQLYVQAPQGQLGKAARSLVAFQKTRLLAAGEQQFIRLTVPIASMASYDDTGKVVKSAYLLEAGDYAFYLGNAVDTAAKIAFTYHEAATRVIRQLSSKVAPVALPKRLLADGSYETLPQGETPNAYHVGNPDNSKAEMKLLGTDPIALEGGVATDKPIQLIDVVNHQATLDDLLTQLTNGELIHLVCGQPCTGVADTGGFGNLPRYGIPNMMTADGPAGLRIGPDCGVKTTAWPSATLLACSWDPALVSQVGQAAARELKENNFGVWLAPALNIHRNPLCGRNFEYYSEDPYVAGQMAAAMVSGIQSEHIGATIKHFCCNNKETNRNHVDSRVSERALREIYLKGFEIAVTKAHPWHVMTSYNCVNGTHPSANAELLKGILRDEWGFDGLVMTDWWNQVDQVQELLCGNNLKMADGDPVRILDALKNGRLTRADLVDNARMVLTVIMRGE
ncbi:glycoside hydrolase family 3 protein [Lacticaseibacillus jixiensis]|uniref:glycoside hydrolase family 3 protein n=1 Tax=Lacticaseibacillus jixiensis TaxID=3231926 RepID=UPI0036F1D419